MRRGDRSCDRNHFRTRTPKGDGNLSRLWHDTNILVSHFRTRTPKGDGNPLSQRLIGAIDFEFQNTNPERGRKRDREHIIRAVVANFRTRTPKGDGNKSIGQQVTSDPAKISEHEPRKGTETGLIEYLSSGLADISEHEPRKGTETRGRGDGRCPLRADFRTRTPKGDGNTKDLIG